MTDFAFLEFRRNRGWPWPEDSFGLTPMYGADGWCRSCGVPNRGQTGSLILQRNGLRAEGAWVPYWRYDAVCVSATLADELAARFDLEFRPVDWHGAPPGTARQIVVPVADEPWFDPEELQERAIARNGTDGATCSACGVWRWMPIPDDQLPPLRWVPPQDGPAIVAGGEWYGDGLKAFHLVLARGDLAQALAEASPRDFASR
jgi:hypothetical protein